MMSAVPLSFLRIAPPKRRNEALEKCTIWLCAWGAPASLLIRLAPFRTRSAIRVDLFLSSKRVTRIELATSAWEANILPLNHTRITRYQYSEFWRQWQMNFTTVNSNIPFISL